MCLEGECGDTGDSLLAHKRAFFGGSVILRLNDSYKNRVGIVPANRVRSIHLSWACAGCPGCRSWTRVLQPRTRGDLPGS